MSERVVNWRHFAEASCASCAHPSNVAGGELCSGHQAQAEAFVDGFEQATRLAVMAAQVHHEGWIAVAPGDGWRRLGVDGAWGDHGGKTLAMFAAKEDALEAARKVPWWPLQGWEVAP